MGEELLAQAARAGAYYIALIILMRLAGKRLAGQTTTFDLIVLITLGVVLQSTALQKGFWNALVFVVTVFALHRLVALLCARSSFFRHLVRGKPRQLIVNGQILERSLIEEGISHAELKAGLRKLGIEDAQQVKVATLEETGHISAVSK
ncbi:MAG TPA: YetF domain-containing protein [Povalibacter sp.]